MKIDVNSGSVEFGQGTVGPFLDRSSFLASKFGITAEVFMSNEPYMTYRIRPEDGVTATLSFNGSRLESVTWLFDLPDEDPQQWTEELELRRKKFHDDWLAQQLGIPPYRFPWGELSSEYDSRGCVSDIILTYAS